MRRVESRRSEWELEKERLESTISLAGKQLEKARNYNENKKEEILAAKKELRENTSHTIGNLWGSEAFEALAELSQYANPVTDKIVDYEEMEKKIILLENLMKAPYFARVDFKFEDEDAFEKIYIGRTSLKKDDSHEMLIYDWRSPIAGIFYRFVKGPAFYDAPGGRITGELDLKRQYEIADGRLEYFFDSEVQIVDEFLRKLLSLNTSPKMKTIVETIQKEQDIVIRDMENDLMMVQGVAGSGKTSVALHRAAYLMYQGLSGKLYADNIIIISPNTLFEQYISNVLPELGEQNVVSEVFEDMLVRILKVRRIQSRNQLLEALITSRRYHRIMKASMEFKMSEVFKELLDLFIADFPHRWIAFEDVWYDGRCIVKKKTLRDKVTGRVETPLGIKLKQLEGYIMESLSAAKGVRITREEEEAAREEMQKFTELNLRGLYQKLFYNKEYLCSLLGKAIQKGGADLAMNSFEWLDEMLTFTKENLSADFLHYEDAAALSYLHLKVYGSDDYKNIKQVVIDEAQDYYPLQFEIFHLLFPNSKFTVLGDMNQTLEKQEDLSLYQKISRILDKKKSSLITMDKSFRCTNEILNYSLKFIEKSPGIKSFNREGEMPEVFQAADQAELASNIIREVKHCQEKGSRSVGLICKSAQNALSLYIALKDRMEVSLIKDQSVSELQGVFLIPVYMSKGLEFDSVLICDADGVNYHSQEDRNLLYIACTRALHRLNLFFCGEKSPLL